MAYNPNSKRTSEEELRRLTSQGLSWVQIGEKLGIEASSLRIVGQVLGIASGVGGWKLTYLGVNPEDLLALLAQGKTLEEIGEKYGVSRQAIHNKLKARGLPTCCREAVKHLAKQQA